MPARTEQVRETHVVVVGGMFVFVFAVVGIGSLVLAIMTAVDASKYPEWAFVQAGTSKFVWQILPIILLFLCGFAGGIMGLIWYSSKRDEVARVARGGGQPPYGYGAPPWGGPPPPPAPPSPPPPSGPPQ
jgi:hypothetical protein